jgi:hypothetical protein
MFLEGQNRVGSKGYTVPTRSVPLNKKKKIKHNPESLSGRVQLLTILFNI